MTISNSIERLERLACAVTVFLFLASRSTQATLISRQSNFYLRSQKSNDPVGVSRLVFTSIGVLIAAIGIFFGWRHWRGTNTVRFSSNRDTRVLGTTVGILLQQFPQQARLQIWFTSAKARVIASMTTAVVSEAITEVTEITPTITAPPSPFGQLLQVYRYIRPNLAHAQIMECITYRIVILMLPSFTGAIPISPLQTKELHRRSDDPKSTDVISVYGLVITTIGVLIAAIGVFGWKRWRGRRENPETPWSQLQNVPPCIPLVALEASSSATDSSVIAVVVDGSVHCSSHAVSPRELSPATSELT